MASKETEHFTALLIHIMSEAQTSTDDKKKRKVSRRVRHKRRFNQLNKFPSKTVGFKPSTIVRMYKKQTKRLENSGEKHFSIYSGDLDKVPRLSKRSSELAASLFEKECSRIFQKLRNLAAHAGRKTVKLEDFDLYLKEHQSAL